MPEPPNPAIFAYSGGASGRISIWRLNAQGVFAAEGEIAVPKAAGEIATRPPFLCLHPSGRFLYAAPPFEVNKDGYAYGYPSSDGKKPFRRSTPVWAYRVEKNGGLTFLQTAMVPAPLDGLYAHPDGKWLYGAAEGALWILRVAVEGGLQTYRATEADTFSAMDIAYAHSAWSLTLHPKGRHAFIAQSSYSMEYDRRFLQRYRIAVDGTVTKEGPRREAWRNDDFQTPTKVSEDTGWPFIDRRGTTAVMQGVSGRVWICRMTAAGDFLPGTPRLMPCKSASVLYHSTRFVGYDRDRDQLYFQENADSRPIRVVYQIIAPGRLHRLGVQERLVRPLRGPLVFNANDIHVYGFA